jgi:phosphoribosyl 1,2-cyclic phosphate phosphodiesterase
LILKEKKSPLLKYSTIKLPVLGYRIDDFCYLTDVKTISDQEQEKLKGP